MANKSNNDIITLISEQLFNQIVLSHNHINTIINYREEDKDYNIHNKPGKNSFIDANTINYIHRFINYIRIISFEYKNVFFIINIFTKNYEDISNYIYLIKFAIICCLYDKDEFKNKISLEIDLYLTELNKKLPDAQGEPIKKKHTKTGYSVFSENIYICIYRKEEWFKSMIQELFFTFTLDLDGDGISYKNIMSNNFCIEDNFLINNSITEFFARLFNTAMFLYFENNVKERELFNSKFKEMIDREKIFAINQAQKILNHFSLEYEDILKLHKPQKTENGTIIPKKVVYKDDSDIFTYFFIPAILFIHQTRFIQWINFEQNNFFNVKKSERELVILGHYIAHCSIESKTTAAFQKKHTNNSVCKKIKFSYHRL